MAETLDALVAHLDRTAARRPKVVVWAHNSHLGDARATEMGQAGELNVGQLVRERHGRDAVLVGFTHLHRHGDGGRRLGRARRAQAVRPALPGSYEALFHDVGLPRFLLDLRATPSVARRCASRGWSGPSA